MAAKKFLTRFFSSKPSAPITPGLYHYMKEHDGLYTRFHLRVEPDSSGMLIANATAAARLSSSGVLIAKSLLEEKGQTDIKHDLNSHFKGAGKSQIQADLDKMQNLLRELANPGDRYPIFNLEDAATSAHHTQLLAPLEADIPLAEPERLRPILDRVWQAAIPHVTFLVPPNLNPNHLVQIVERAEDLGLICGVSGRASDLGQGALLDHLAQAGVDHVTLFYASANPEIHDTLFGQGDHAAAELAFARTQKLEVADVGHVPLVAATLDGLDETLAALLKLQVPNAAFFAIATPNEKGMDGAIPAQGMRQVAAQIEEDADEAQVRYIWETPVQHNPEQPLTTQIRQGPRCSGDVAVRIEPDGSVIPPRGPYQSAGNILQDSWSAIWSHAAFRIYRERVEAPTRCDICPGLTICAADCPCEPAGWARG